jgi:hypothetical protein
VLESDDDMVLFARFVTPKNSLFTTYKEYHPNRRLWMKYERYNNDGFTKGIFYEYNEEGKLIKAIDWDKPFNFTWEQVKKYCEEELKLDLIKDNIGIGNNLEYPDYNFPMWSISYLGQYMDNSKYGLIHILINGNTGELVKVTRQLGNGGEGTIVDVLYDAKAEKQKKEEDDNTYFTTYKGKDYTKKEWEIFKEEWHKNHEENKNKGFWDDIFKKS